MSLTEWMVDIFGSLDTLVAVLLATAVFTGLYIYSASRLLGARKDSLARIRRPDDLHQTGRASGNPYQSTDPNGCPRGSAYPASAGMQIR